MVGTPFTAKGPLSVPHGLSGLGLGLRSFSSRGKSGLMVLMTSTMGSKSFIMAGLTVSETGASGPPSLFTMLLIFSSLSSFLLTQEDEPSKPNSSPAQSMARMVRFGRPPAAMIWRAASITGVAPEPSSTPPVATS